MNTKIEPFEKDVHEHQGYVYTTSKKLSTRLALEKHRDLILAAADFTGRRLLDAGCGDGFSTFRIHNAAKPLLTIGVDAAKNPIAVAKGKAEGPTIDFLAANLHHLPFESDSFDIVLLQGVLHHDDRARDLIKEVLRVAPEVIILEPNGNNPALKIIEKVSTYHREHLEKSYSSALLRRWVVECDATVVKQSFGGFVPIFCPDWLARSMKRVEPLVERIPFINAIACAVTITVAKRASK